MKAAFINKLGDANQIVWGSLPEPVIDVNEVLVKVQKVSVNHVDTFIRSGVFETKLSFPFIIGRDAIGTVVKLGANVRDFKLGQLVWTNSMGYDGRQGTYAELVCVPKDRLFLVPDQVNSTQLIAAVHSAATAAILLTDVLHAEPNNQILIEGAGGHVGRKLVSLANTLGLSVSSTSNKNDFERLKKIGVRQTFDYREKVDRINTTFDYIIDTSGKVELQTNLSLLNQNGKIGLITAPATNQAIFNVRQFYMNDLSILGFVISHTTQKQLMKAAEILNDNFTKGLLLDDEVLELPITEAKNAQLMLESGQNRRQRIILNFD